MIEVYAHTAFVFVSKSLMAFAEVSFPPAVEGAVEPALEPPSFGGFAAAV